MTDRGPWMGTYSGGKFYPLDPRVEEIHLEDIIHHLANTCRYGGAVRNFYSVAEHSVLVSLFVPPPFAQEALLHDAAEAYVGDLISPIKHQPDLARFTEIEDKIYPVVMERFGVFSSTLSRGEIAKIDSRICADETAQFMNNPGKYTGRVPLGCNILGLSPDGAKNFFLSRFLELFPEWVS